MVRYVSSKKGSDQKVRWVEKIKLYVRLARINRHNPSWLVAAPCLWAIGLATDSGTIPDAKLMVLFNIWGVLIRGAACTINDYFDRDFDCKVERTRKRPIACGAVTPAEGLLVFGVQMILGLAILLPINYFSFMLGVLHVPLIVAYPLMKRITYWPQGFLGLMFSWGGLLGWSAVTGSLDLPIMLPFYMSGVFWMLVIDTIYAHQDKSDDVKAGVKSTALLFGSSTKKWVSVFAVACIGCLALSGINANIGWMYHAFLAIAFGHFVWQIFTVDLSNPKDCDNKFTSNGWFAGIVLAGVLLGRFFP